MRALIVLSLTLFLTACGGKPFVVEVPKYIERPAICGQKERVALNSGDSANAVIAAQNEALSRYEVKVEVCYSQPVTKPGT